MNYSKVVLILGVDDYSLLGEALEKLSIPGVSVSKLRGYGKYFNEYSSTGLSDSIKVETYCESSQAESIAEALAQLAAELTETGGIVAIEPVSRLYNLRAPARDA